MGVKEADRRQRAVRTTGDDVNCRRHGTRKEGRTAGAIQKPDVDAVLIRADAFGETGLLSAAEQPTRLAAVQTQPRRPCDRLLHETWCGSARVADVRTGRTLPGAASIALRV